jgi:hypothetical protein
VCCGDYDHLIKEEERNSNVVLTTYRYLNQEPSFGFIGTLLVSCIFFRFAVANHVVAARHITERKIRRRAGIDFAGLPSLVSNHS